MAETIKLRAGRYMIPVSVTHEDEYLYLRFRYNKKLLAEIKSMDGAYWCAIDDPAKKIWRINNNARNHFQLDYLRGKNPYAHYDAPIQSHEYQRSLYAHQCEISDFILTRHYCIIAGDMGIGKTLAVIEVMERSEISDWWYIVPRFAMYEIRRELRKWNAKVIPTMMTYEGLTKAMKNWQHGDKAPRGVIFDEAHKIKNPKSQRSQAAMALANGIRKDWGNAGYVIEMTGTPAPKSPVDWWHQCEAACPGFLREGTQIKFKHRLALIVERETQSGGVYPHIETWLDDEKKCAICGKYEEDNEEHDTKTMASLSNYHKFESSKNEVAALYHRMKGLVLVKLKKDCLDLPDKIYRTIDLEPNQTIRQIANTIVSSATSTIGGLILLRELSDGFQYHNEPCGQEICSVCNGSGKIPNPLKGADYNFENHHPSSEDDLDEVSCDGCGGKGVRKKYKRITRQIECPKDGALRDLLEEYNEIGRIVIYAGFTGSVDRCVDICDSCGWETIRVDGRGCRISINDKTLSKETDPLAVFQDKCTEYPRVAFIGHPEAAGTGLTLTASPVIVYYSNDFKADSRIQSEDRIHRFGMDVNRGAIIVDLMHLPTDKLVLDNLRKKRDLQSLSLGEVVKVFGESNETSNT